jgi:hypothetical protein
VEENPENIPKNLPLSCFHSPTLCTINTLDLNGIDSRDLNSDLSDFPQKIPDTSQSEIDIKVFDRTVSSDGRVNDARIKNYTVLPENITRKITLKYLNYQKNKNNNPSPDNNNNNNLNLITEKQNEISNSSKNSTSEEEEEETSPEAGVSVSNIPLNRDDEPGVVIEMEKMTAFSQAHSASINSNGQIMVESEKSTPQKIEIYMKSDV